MGEGVGFADERGHCLPLSVKVSALLTEEVIAFPFGEGVGIADGRGLCDRKCPHSAELNESKNKKVRALCRLGISDNGCMRERCRPPQTIVIVGIKGDKEGSTTT